MGIENEEVDQVEPAEDKSVAGAFKNAWDALASKDEPEPKRAAPESAADEAVAGEPEDDAPGAKPEGDARARDEKGKFLAKDKQPVKAEAVKPIPQAKPGEKVDPKAAAAADPAKPAPPATKPPQSWNMKERADWDKVPAGAQQAILRRDREVAQAFQQLAPHRQAAERFNGIVTPYIGMLKAEGGDPFETAASLFQTWAALRTAPPAAKAGLVAQIISQFGVDPSVVAEHLAGKAPKDAGQGFDPNQFAQQLEQRIVGSLEQRQQTQLAQHHAAQLAEFESSHDLIDEPVELRDGSASTVRAQMGALIRAGIAHDFEDAYNRVVAMDSRLRGVVQQREEAEQAKTAKVSTQRARAASSSLRGSPAGPKPKPQPDSSIKGAFDRAYDELSGQDR